MAFHQEASLGRRVIAREMDTATSIGIAIRTAYAKIWTARGLRKTWNRRLPGDHFFPVDKRNETL
jgi:hypothetical protein